MTAFCQRFSSAFGAFYARLLPPRLTSFSFGFWPAYRAYLRCWGQQTNCQQLSIFSIWTVKLHANPIKLLTLRRGRPSRPLLAPFSFVFAIYFNSFSVFRIVLVLPRRNGELEELGTGGQ